MPLIEAELPDGRVLEFPEGTTPEVVKATVKKMLAPDQPQPSGQRFLEAGLRGAIPGSGRGIGIGGPVGAVSALIGEYDKQGNEALQRAAYHAGGAATDLAAKAGASPEVAGALGYGTNVGVQAIPVALGGSGAKKITPMLESAAAGIMKSAVKPSFDNLANGNAAKAIKTMLAEGVNATEGGMAKLQTKINELKNQVKTVIANSPAEIDRSKVAEELLGTLDRVQKQALYKGDVKKVEAAFDEFMTHPLVKGDKIPVQLAQDMKKAGNKKLSDDYGELSSADIESQKALVRGLKQEIEKNVPEVAALNKKQAELLNALKVAQRRSLMEGNKSMGGLAPLAENPIAGGAMMFDRSSLGKSLLARALNANSGTIPVAGGSSLSAILSGVSGQAPPERPTLADIIRRGAPSGRVGGGTR